MALWHYVRTDTASEISQRPFQRRPFGTEGLVNWCFEPSQLQRISSGLLGLKGYKIVQEQRSKGKPTCCRNQQSTALITAKHREQVSAINAFIKTNKIS